MGGVRLHPRAVPVTIHRASCIGFVTSVTPLFRHLILDLAIPGQAISPANIEVSQRFSFAGQLENGQIGGKRSHIFNNRLTYVKPAWSR